MSDHRFAIIPGWVVTHPDLKGKMLQVICLLGRHTDKQGWCRRSQVKMSEEIGCARSTVQSALDSLIDIGAVERREVVSENGRDSAHWYRVIYDRDTPSHAFGAWDVEDREEFDPNAAAVSGGTPAGIPAPPAGPESAPPAGSGPAPINDPNITPPVEPVERDAREAAHEDPKAIERAFWRLVKNWPGFEGMPKEPARGPFFELSAEERERAINRFPAWLDLLKAQKKSHVPAPSTYLREKLFNAVPDAAPERVVPVAHDPFSKAWFGLLLAEVSRPMATAWPALTIFQRGEIAKGGDAARAVELERRRKYGWPKAASMADVQRPVTVPVEIVEMSEGFVSVARGSDLFERWRAMFDRHGWPWPLSDWKWFHLPPGEPEDAMAEFQARLREDKGHDDAA